MAKKNSEKKPFEVIVKVGDTVYLNCTDVTRDGLVLFFTDEHGNKNTVSPPWEVRDTIGWRG